MYFYDICVLAAQFASSTQHTDYQFRLSKVVVCYWGRYAVYRGFIYWGFSLEATMVELYGFMLSLWGYIFHTENTVSLRALWQLLFGLNP